MANPNLNALTGVYADSASVKVTTTTLTSLLSNAASSGKVLLVESLIIANVSGSNATFVTVQVWSSATAGSGTGTAICSEYQINAKDVLVAISKETPIKLKEGQSLSITISAASSVDCNLSWTELT